METQIELIKKDLTLFKEETERRINLLEENIKKLTGEERNLSDNILLVDWKNQRKKALKEYIPE